jgi:hypothetical protein
MRVSLPFNEPAVDIDGAATASVWSALTSTPALVAAHSVPSSPALSSTSSLAVDGSCDELALDELGGSDGGGDEEEDEEPHVDDAVLYDEQIDLKRPGKSFTQTLKQVRSQSARTASSSQAAATATPTAAPPAASAVMASSPSETSATLADDYLFYQAVDGQNLFLHSLNYRCLLHEMQISKPVADPLIMLPPRIRAKVLQIETHRMTHDIRKRFRFVSHLPLSSLFSLVEVDLSPGLSVATLDMFGADIAQRQQARVAAAKAQRAAQKKALRATQRAEAHHARQQAQRGMVAPHPLLGSQPVASAFLHLPQALTAEEAAAELAAAPALTSTPAIPPPVASGPWAGASRKLQESHAADTSRRSLPPPPDSDVAFPMLSSKPVPEARGVWGRSAVGAAAAAHVGDSSSATAAAARETALVEDAQDLGWHDTPVAIKKKGMCWCERSSWMGRAGGRRSL